MYHSIGASNNGEIGAGLYSVSVKNFREQMQWIVKMQGESPKSQEGPCVSFDDGDITNYQYAYPLLKEFGLKAYFFILAGRVGNEGYMNWRQISELNSAGMIIGSHGMSHRILTELNDEELDYELKESKKILEENLNKQAEYLSIPRGFYNQKVIAKAKDAGYRAVFTSSAGDSDEFKFGRIPVKGSWGLAYFSKITNSGPSLKDKGEELIKNASKKMLGAKNYDKLRTVILGHSSYDL